MPIGEIAGYLAAVFATTTMFPQLIKTLKTQKTEDLSFSMLVLALLGNICWFINGYTVSSTPLMVSAVLISLCLIPIIIVKLRNMVGDNLQTQE